MGFEFTSQTDAALVSTRRISRRAALTTGGAGLLGAAASLRAPRVASARQATPVAEAEQSLPADLQLALANIVLSGLAESYTPGAIVGIWIPGQGNWSLAAGLGDITNATPMRLDDHFRIASITKTFVATVALQLVAEGTLSLDDRLDQFIAGIPNGNEITLRQVLGMTGGIYNYVYDPVIAVDYARDPLLPFSPDQAIEIVRTHAKADFAPGEQFLYSDTNYILIGLIIEQVTGHTIDAEISDRIITPLGLTGASFPVGTPEMPEPYAHGYAASAPAAPLRDVTQSNPDIAWAAGAMISTMHDLRVWCNTLLAGTLLPPELQAERLRMTYAATEPLAFGYGLGIMEMGGLIGHNGGIMGYGSWMVQDPASGTTIVMVANEGGAEGGDGSSLIFLRIAALLFPDRGFSAFLDSMATPAPSGA